MYCDPKLEKNQEHGEMWRKKSYLYAIITV